MKTLRLAFLPILLLAITGCTFSVAHVPHGPTVLRATCFFDQALGKGRIAVKGTNGMEAIVGIDTYTSKAGDNIRAAGAAVGEAGAALMKKSVGIP